MDGKRADRKATGLGPWPDVATARSFLRQLLVAGPQSESWQAGVEPELLAPWLVRQGLGPLAHARFKDVWPTLTSRLQEDLFLAAGENSLHMERIGRVARGFAEAGLPLVLLKGAALAKSAYRDPAFRPMSDTDILVPEGQMAAALQLMEDAGFVTMGKESGPPALQEMADGEVQFATAEGGLVEFHLSPFSGWWLQRVAAAEKDAVWGRVEPIGEPVRAREEGKESGGVWQAESFYQLGPEDMIIHLAVHLAVNHQFGLWPVRSLVDIAMVARSRSVDWEAVAIRAEEWRLATAVWAVLDLVDSLIGLPEMAPALARLRPSRLRRTLLARLVSPESILSGRDLRTGRERHILLLLLVDRPRDALRLVFRTLWPEGEWLDARYPQGDVSRWQHLWRVLRHGQI